MSELLDEKHLALISKHKLKREKELICAYENLTNYDVDTLIQYCYDAKDNEQAHLLLASLFTGRSIMALLDVSTAVDEFVAGEFGVLTSSISHPKVPESSNSKQVERPANSSPYVFLSSSILRSVQNARDRKFEDYKTKLKNLVSEINKKNNARLTLGRIQRYLAKEAKDLNISQAEVGWISNTPLKDHAGSSYLSMSSGDLARKHYTFINRLLESAGKAPFSLEVLLTSPDAAKMMGSNRGLSNDDLKVSFVNIRESIDASRASLPTTLWQLYNDYTHFTVSLLMVNTGHRPTRDPFGSLRNFDLNREVVWVQDKKAREEASRLVPLNTLSELQIRYYLSFLKDFSGIVKYSHPGEAEKLKQSLSGEAPLFRLRNTRGLTFYSASTVRDHCSSPIPGSSNWHRHWIRQHLASQSHVDVSAVDAFMAHENLLDESFSRFSTLETLELRKVSNAIEQQLQKLDVNALEVTL